MKEQEEDLKALHERVVEEVETIDPDLVMGRLFINSYDHDMISDILSLSMIEGRKIIYLSSPGGLATAASILIDVINEEAEQYTIKICELIASGAFLTILNAKCKVEQISQNMKFFTIYMAHDLHIKGRLNKHVKEVIKKTKEDMFQAIVHVLTDEQIKHYRNCHRLYRVLPFMKKFIKENIYLSVDQMKELLGDRFSVVGEKDV